MCLKVLGRKAVPSFQPPAVYTGELIGIDYLFRQTGRPLQDIQPDSEETEQMLDDVCTEEQGDEGFEDAVYDPTVEWLDLSSDPSPTSSSTPSSLHSTASPPRPGCSSTAAASEHHLNEYEDTDMPPVPSAPPAGSLLLRSTSLSATTSPAARNTSVARRALDFLPRELPGPSAVTTSSASMLPLPTTLSTTVPTATVSSASQHTTPAAPAQHLAVDERCIPGMDLVDCLADYLVGLRLETGLTLTNLQASTIIALWQNLLPYDRQRVEYAARHKSRLITGRFRCSKQRAEFTPGVESTTRCVLGSTGSPAQWPDCCRLVESIFIKLCRLYKSPKKQGSQVLTRWTLIMNDYIKIRELVLGNGVVMQDITLQLFEVNQTTLIQWHNKRLKRQDCSILLQGVNLPPAIPIAPVPLPPMQSHPTAAPPHPGAYHQYHLPESTVGKAVDKRKSVRPTPPVYLPPAIHVAPVPLPPVQSRPTAAPPQLGPQHRFHLPHTSARKAADKRKSALPAEHPHPPKAVCPGLPSLVTQQTHPHSSAPIPVVPTPIPPCDMTKTGKPDSYWEGIMYQYAQGKYRFSTVRRIDIFGSQIACKCRYHMFLRVINPADQEWIAQCLYKATGCLRQEASKNWFLPPDPPKLTNVRPDPMAYFRQRMFLWAPMRMWSIPIKCVQCNSKMHHSGIYPKAREVIDLDSSECGQLLNCVLTTVEGAGLDELCRGIVKRYKKAGEPEPELSNCIFEWDQDDICRLKEAKKSKLQKQHAGHAPTEAQVLANISSSELARHCKRRTLGVEETRRLIDGLLESMWELTDTTGLRLINPESMTKVWETPQKHLTCIQDPPGVELYTKVRSGSKKGDKVLDVLRCGRGSSSV
ncbi:uncharacterized protein LOC128460597 [Pleuronectes platessa]|uniref:uncharacterized protein LOC128460597 n=1 Tax=Pleuronectes platessa TaxID=8262 RepID=UPI00232A3D4B|nr:uncharacterized protein LOC128460597 [Pleuronectes platessa]